MSQTRASMLVLLLAAVLGCAVGPNYQRPDMAVPQQWAHDDQSGLSAGVVAVLQWWQTLQDPMLDALIERAVHTNLDLRMATVRFAAGLRSELDVAQARANLATTESQVPVLETSRTHAMHRLSVLLGKPPGALLGELARVQPIPLGPASVPIGLPSDVLRRRPDVRRAEQELAAATARNKRSLGTPVKPVL